MTIKTIDAKIAGTRRMFLVGSVEGEPVGIATIDYLHTPFPALWNLYIEPGHRRKGYASQIIEQVIDICREQQAEAVCLSVSKTNGPAIALYQKLGFKPRELDSPLHIEHILTKPLK